MSRKLDSTEKIDSTTQTDINHWNLDLTKEQPEPYHYGGKANAGKILKVSNDGFIRLGTGGGGGTTYTGTNGITVDNVGYTIGLDTTGATTPELANLKVSGDFVLDKGADFNASAGAEVNVYCPAEFTAEVNMINAEVTLPNVILTVRTGQTVKGDVTTNEWTLLTKNLSGYVKWGNDKYYYVKRVYDTTTPTLVNKLIYENNAGKVEISRIAGVYPAPDTYEWVYSDNSSGEPATYIKNIAKASNVVTATKKDDTTVTWDEVTANPTLAGTESDLTGIQVGATKYKVSSGGGGSISIIEKTYAELKTMKDGGTLVAGQYYRITDYVATTAQTNTQSANHPFDIIILAIANNKFSEECTAIQHSGDTYFANSDLTSWRVWYSFDNDNNIYGWADSTSGKGVIYWLQDEFLNSAWYDFKGIQVKNTNASDKWYYLFHNTTGDVDASLGNGTSFPDVYGNNFGFFATDYKLNIGCNVIKATICRFNTIGNDFTNNTIGDSFYSNTIGDAFYNNTIGNYFNGNTIGNYFYTNTIGNDFYNNTIGNYFYNNTIGNNFRNNTIGNNLYTNTIGNYFYANAIGNYFNSNTIGNDFNSNTIGNGFIDNTIGTSTTDIYYQNNSFGSGIECVDITDYGTSSAYKSGISLPNGYAGTYSSHKSITSLRNNTTYYIGSDSTLKTLD